MRLVSSSTLADCPPATSDKIMSKERARYCVNEVLLLDEQDQ